MKLRIGRSCKRVFSRGAQPSMTFCALLAVAGLFAGTASARGWKGITPDAAFHHWTRFSIPPDTPPDAASQWTRQPDGTIYCTGRGGHEFYRYDHELGNFDLHVEWMFPKLDPTPKYNSGVFVRNDTDGAEWYQAQVGPPASGGYFFYGWMENGVKKKIDLHREMKADAVKPPGEWNVYDIHAEGAHITLKVNGVLTSEFDCKRLKGYIGLEAEHSPVVFRDIRLKELP